MAGDWIKIEHALPDKPEIMEMANLLGIDSDAVVGKLIRVWTWFDTHTEDGNANVTVRALLDRYAGVTNFVSAMASVGWIKESEGIISVIHFDRHNGQTAKNRANTNRRVAKSRKRNGASVTNATVEPLQKPLPEKRREEKRKYPPNPQGGMDGEEINSDKTILPANWKRLNEKARKMTKVHRNTETMEKIGLWFGRRPETLWTVAEAVALIENNPPENHIDGMGRYYTAQIPTEDYRRRDLQTLLNNWTSELDRARKFVTSQNQ